MSADSAPKQFEPIGFGLARDPDSVCTSCGGVVLSRYKELHLKWCPGKDVKVVQTVQERETAAAEAFMAVDEPDMVNHPPHYNAHPTGIECIDIVEHLGFNIGNAVKYLWRQGLKFDSIQDMEKAIWYVQREIERRKRESEWAAARTNTD